MKKHISLIFLFFASCISTYAQQYKITYTKKSAIEMKSILVHDKDSNGIFHPVYEPRYYSKVSGDVTFYAFDKKNKKLYVCDAFDNYEFTLTESEAKSIKKDKDIPRLSGKELAETIENTNNRIKANVKAHNNKIKQALADSARVQAQRDSIARALELARIEKKKEEYRRTKDWKILPLGKSTLYCNMCDEYTHYDTDSVICLAIRNDTIYYAYPQKEYFDFERIGFHATYFSDKLKKDSAIAFHYEVFKDSLQQYEFTNDGIEFIENRSWNEYFDKLKEFAPYGFVYSWSWKKNYSFVELDLTYTNLNKKTIRYMDIYVTAFNDVGDVRGTGQFSGTGPIACNHRAGWNWDNSDFYVADDVTKLRLSKIVITYMDKTKKVLTGNNLKIKY